MKFEIYDKAKWHYESKEKEYDKSNRHKKVAPK